MMDITSSITSGNPRQNIQLRGSLIISLRFLLAKIRLFIFVPSIHCDFKKCLFKTFLACFLLQLFQRTEFLQFTVLHNCNAASQMLRFFHLMSCDDDSHLALEGLDNAPKLTPCHNVKSQRRLIKDQPFHNVLLSKLCSLSKLFKFDVFICSPLNIIIM